MKTNTHAPSARQLVEELAADSSALGRERLAAACFACDIYGQCNIPPHGTLLRLTKLSPHEKLASLIEEHVRAGCRVETFSAPILDLPAKERELLRTFLSCSSPDIRPESAPPSRRAVLDLFRHIDTAVERFVARRKWDGEELTLMQTMPAKDLAHRLTEITDAHHLECGYLPLDFLGVAAALPGPTAERAHRLALEYVDRIERSSEREQWLLVARAGWTCLTTLAGSQAPAEENPSDAWVDHYQLANVERTLEALELLRSEKPAFVADLFDSASGVLSWGIGSDFARNTQVVVKTLGKRLPWLSNVDVLSLAAIGSTRLVMSVCQAVAALCEVKSFDNTEALCHYGDFRADDLLGAFRKALKTGRDSTLLENFAEEARQFSCVPELAERSKRLSELCARLLSDSEQAPA